MCRPTKRSKTAPSQVEGADPAPFEPAGVYDFKRPSDFDLVSAAPQVKVEDAVFPPSSKQTFVYTTYDMVSNEDNAAAVGWDSTGMLIQIRDSAIFGEEILPKYFRHKNVTSFYRQLNSYGFRTVKTSSVEVSHTFLCDLFRRDRPDLLPMIVRKKATPPPAALAAAAKAQQKRNATPVVATTPVMQTPAPAQPVVTAAPTASPSSSTVMRMIQELQEFQRNQQLRAEQLEANIRRLSGENSKILKEGESVISSMKQMVYNQTDAIEKLFGPKAGEAFVTQLKAETELPPSPMSMLPPAPPSPYVEADPFGFNTKVTGNFFQEEPKILLPDEDLLELETLLAFEDDGFMF